MPASLSSVRLRTWAGYAAGLAVVCFVYFAVRREAGAIHAVSPVITLPAAVLSLAAGLAASVLSAWSWTAALRTLDVECTFRDASRVWYASMLARYAPGTLPGVAYRVYLTTGIGAPPGLAAAATALDWVLWVLSALLAALLTAPWWIGSAGLPFRLNSFSGAAVAAATFIAALLLLHPRTIALLVRKAAAKAGGEAQPLTYRRTLVLLPIYLAKWPFYGVSMAAFLPVGHGPAAISSAWMARLAASTGAFAVGWIAGFVSPLSPGGIGVREGIIVGVLRGAALGPAVLGAALLSRLTTTAAEVLCWGWTARRGGSQ